jgi:hypothetical protein
VVLAGGSSATVADAAEHQRRVVEAHLKHPVAKPEHPVTAADDALTADHAPVGSPQRHVRAA